MELTSRQQKINELKLKLGKKRFSKVIYLVYIEKPYFNEHYNMYPDYPELGIHIFKLQVKNCAGYKNKYHVWEVSQEQHHSIPYAIYYNGHTTEIELHYNPTERNPDNYKVFFDEAKALEFKEVQETKRNKKIKGIMYKKMLEALVLNKLWN